MSHDPFRGPPNTGLPFQEEVLRKAQAAKGQHHNVELEELSPEQAAALFRDDPESSYDPWRHRAKDMRCRTCMWYARKEGVEPDDNHREIGRCRRHAPTMNGYPAVFPTDWCGDHKLDEMAL